jgi:cytochrome c oxidase subunit 3
MSTVSLEFEDKKASSFKMILWFAMLSMFMVFAGLTSAYVVSQSRPDWLNEFQLPVAFTWSTLIVIISSVTFYLAQKSASQGNQKRVTLLLLVTLALGIAFVFSQFKGFDQVISEGYRFTGKLSTITTSFIYVVVVVHLAHLFGGLVALFLILYKQLKGRYTKADYLGIELGAMFWHFLGFLWCFLFLFFYFYK